jgi:pyruvate-ferredoxin/flavodoxin oxidoreductase
MRNTAIRWYRKVFGAPAGSDIREEGLATVLDGNTAVTLSEAGIATHAVLGGTAPMAGADEVWLGEVAHGTNLFGQALAAQTAEGPRGIVAAATGLGLAGCRATAFLSGPDVAASQDLLISAAGKHVPLVLHVGARAAAAHGSAPGTGHDTVHLGADSGFCVLFAANVQQAVDFTYVARRVTEETLVPVMVVMDGEQTALAAQDVRLLSPAQVNALLGAPEDRIDSPTEAQRLLFGETRRRVPAWHDLDEPVLTGALFDANSYGLGALARGPFFDSFVATSLDAALKVFESKTGRRNEAVSSYRLKDASTVLVVQGSAVETACCAADYIRKHHKVKVGVLGIHVLRPFPAAEIGAALNGRQRAFVLERVSAPLAGDPPLTREVRANLERSRSGPKHACQAVVYGVGGQPVRLADLAELCTRQDLPAAVPLFLGVSFDDPAAAEPKREVLLDALRRAYPDVAARGVLAAGAVAATAAPRSTTIAIRRTDGKLGRTILEAAAAMLHKLEEGRVRSRPAIAWDGWGEVLTDWLVVGDDSLQDPGDGLVADVTLDADRNQLRIKETAWQLAPAAESDRSEWLLGALFGALLDAEVIDHKPRRIVSARRAMLDSLATDRRDALASSFESGFAQVSEGSGTPPDAAPGNIPWDGEAPVAVRHLGRNDDVFASLPRFWDQAGVLYRDGEAERLTADPFLATGTMPPLSATFNTTSGKRTRMPAFEPALCTGCARCWTNCPDSAIGVVAAGPAALIDAGIRLGGADAVRPVASKLAGRIISASKKADAPAPNFGTHLEDAYAWLKDKMPLDEDRKQAIDEGVAAIVSELGALPVAVTQPFFHDAEAVRKDGAEFLSIVINPDACKSCGICVRSCADEALKPVEQDTDTLLTARSLWSVFSDAPDTASETIERVAGNADIGRMSSILLSRYCQFAMSGGDQAEAGSGEKIAVRSSAAAGAGFCGLASGCRRSTGKTDRRNPVAHPRRRGPRSRQREAEDDEQSEARPARASRERR